MQPNASDPSTPSSPTPAKPPGTREFTLRSVIAGIFVAAVMGAAYPYIVLKLGFGPNMSVVAAFLGYLMLGIIFRDFNRWENNIVQTAGTSAAQTAFMCYILAAFDFLAQRPQLGFHFSPTPLQSFFWLTFASVLGLLLAVPMRRHYVVDEKLPFADGIAAAETIVVLDSRGAEAKQAARLLFGGTIASGLVMLLTSPYGGSVLPEEVAQTFFGLATVGAGAGFAVSLLSVGSGMIVGNRINLSMAGGALLSWIIAPKILYPMHLIAGVTRREILLWVMWPGTALLLAAGLTALALKWRMLARTFSTLSKDSVGSDEFPLKWVGAGVTLTTIGLVVVQRVVFGLPIWLTVIAVALSVPLMLVGLRVLGETNWGPISQLTVMMQAIFAGLTPGNLIANLGAAGTTGTIATQSEAIMQDYKAGDIIGSTPKYLTYSQLIAAPIGAAVVAWMYPLLRSTYGIGGSGLSSPISVRIAGFAEVLSRGASALPPYALHFFALFAIFGVLIALGETKMGKYLPSPTGIGIGMMVPGSVVFTMVLGGFAMSLWERLDKKSADRLGMPLASGLMAGEAIVAVVIPFLVAVGLVNPR
jgi:uncharacterized oligopeptide transporter (OPT) family protein